MKLTGALLICCCTLTMSGLALADGLAVVGTGDGMPVLRALGRGFTAQSRGTNILIPPSIHSSGGIRAVVLGEAVLGRIARPLQGAELGHGLRVVPIFRQPVAFFAHQSARVVNLTAAQTVSIYTGMVRNWREVGGADHRIRTVRREESDSSLMVLRQTIPGWGSLKLTEERSKLATTTQETFDTVVSFDGAIGFGPYSVDLEQQVLVLRIEGLHPLEPEYPSALTLSLIYRDATVTKPALGFIEYIFSIQGQQIIRDLGAVPYALTR